MNEELMKIASEFHIDGRIHDVVSLSEGFINDTYFVRLIGEEEPAYVLQRKNQFVFRNVPAMMQNINLVTSHLKKIITEKGGDPMRESLTITPALSGNLYYRDKESEIWAMCTYIKKSKNFQRVDSPELACAGGKAIGKFHSMLADFEMPLTDILPGFHNMRFRFDQWDQSLAENVAGRVSGLNREIEWIENRRNEMMEFYSLIENQKIKSRVAHNDTKISNVLFDDKGDVLCLIDLDTVFNSAILNDFGDAIRTYANTGEEDDTRLDSVNLNLEIFESFSRGYLAQAIDFLSEPELEYLAFSAKYITFEQVLRFLMDYINGDKYYKIKSPEHNLQRTYAQYKLLQSMENNFDYMKQSVKNIVLKYK